MFDSDDEEPMVMLGFARIDDLINFINWVNENFDDPEDLRDYMEETIDNHITSYTQCERIREVAKRYEYVCDIDDCGNTFVTTSGLNLHKKIQHGVDPSKDFWDIINNSYTNHQKEIRDHLRNTD